MPDLQTLQKYFQDYLFDRSHLIESHIVDAIPVSAKMRLDIYRDGYYLRLLEAMSQDYDVLRALITEETFDQWAREYIQAYPSHFRSIRWYGKEFSDFLKQKTDQNYLIEMAKFEWLLTESFDAADSPVISMDTMAAIPPENWPLMRFELHPSLRQLTLSSNAVAIWQSYKDKNQLLTPEEAETPAPWIIWRKEYDILFCSLTPAENSMIQALIQGLPFKNICEDLSEWVPEDQVAMEAALFLKRLILDHLIIDVTA